MNRKLLFVLLRIADALELLVAGQRDKSLPSRPKISTEMDEEEIKRNIDRLVENKRKK